MEKILVIGSSNTDLIATMDHFPEAGETLEGIAFQYAMGGKGANQAVAAHKTGGRVTFITSIGKDSSGQNMLQYLRNTGLDVSHSLLVDDETTGTAMIWVDKHGENSIVIIPGANKCLSPGYVKSSEKTIAESDIIVLQMEIPYESVKAICQIASYHQKKVILNVAPACNIEEEILKSVYILVVNETEAELITGEKIKDIGEDAIVNKLLLKGVQNVVLTLGEKGSVFKNKDECIRIPAFKVDVLDTTAAGDTFCGALATGISKSKNMKEVLQFANAAAALCVTRLGAQPSIPAEEEVNKFLNQTLINN